MRAGSRHWRRAAPPPAVLNTAAGLAFDPVRPHSRVHLRRVMTQQHDRHHGQRADPQISPGQQLDLAEHRRGLRAAGRRHLNRRTLDRHSDRFLTAGPCRRGFPAAGPSIRRHQPAAHRTAGRPQPPHRAMPHPPIRGCRESKASSDCRTLAVLRGGDSPDPGLVETGSIDASHHRGEAPVLLIGLPAEHIVPG